MTRSHHILFSLIIVFCLPTGFETKAQSISFSNINTSNGFSGNNVQSVAIDKKGFLWIGTINGLNVYDGYAVTVFKKESQPAMASNNVIHLTCDSKNRI